MQSKKQKLQNTQIFKNTKIQNQLKLEMHKTKYKAKYKNTKIQKHKNKNTKITKRTINTRTQAQLNK